MSVTMMISKCALLFPLLLLPEWCTAFVPLSRRANVWVMRATSSSGSVDDLRDEIEAMKQEALQRMEALNRQVTTTPYQNNTTTTATVAIQPEAPSTTRATATVSTPSSSTPRSAPVSVTSPTSEPLDKADRISLLEGTRWKVVLNIGREKGTWMPETWGASGERLLMNLELDFSDEQLYDREEFLSSVGGAKVLKVVNREVMLGPTLKENSRAVAVKGLGGWRVAPGEGPCGTDLLRFYIELEEEVGHKGSDVVCPSGRVYGTCGYFPTADRSGGRLKDAIRKEQEAISRRFEQINQQQQEDTSLLSFKKVQRAREMMQLRFDADKLKSRMEEARVREPERALLSQSKNELVSLTKEGGLCCKVSKRLSVEYHILGKFSLAGTSVTNEDSEKTLLP